MLDRWIPAVLICLLAVACALERDGLGKIVVPGDAQAQEDEDAGVSEGDLDAGSVLNADALFEPETGIPIIRDAGAAKDTGSPYQRDTGPG